MSLPGLHTQQNKRSFSSRCPAKGGIEETNMSSFSRPDRHRTPLFTRATHLGASKHDLERDSGFSDASSEYLSTVDLTDSEDAGRNGSIVGQDPSGPQVAVMGGSYAGLSPMIIMNNFVLKQPSPIPPGEKQWGFPSPLEVMPQSQVVLLQPMVSNNSSSSPKISSENVRQSKSYMPILKSYPRIAPHPADSPTKRAGSVRPALQSPIKPISNFEKTSSQSQAAESQEQLSDKSLSPLAGTSSLTPYTDEFRTEVDSDSMHADKYQDPFSLDNNKLKRFSNTYNILNKSGLLGITMRTKQLIKENRRTQGQLQQLQEQTALLLEALSSGDPELWTKLQLSLQHTDKEQWGAKAQRVLE
ncbi:CLOCK-interacting pacemaker CLOCK-interacting circadian protein [Larimichthys crocea]|uniref:CLOCK-interacting pacemaker CLOCK-interacting circadian protein n=1 Tax=Larimichthys crocea TaxID=215358 RepID=A0A6G0IEV3_LARCR|nr:CLOCK-interacting pacemaker CLOCK-interacting circadian protein [Larimichthys crocea]